MAIGTVDLTTAERCCDVDNGPCCEPENHEERPRGGRSEAEIREGVQAYYAERAVTGSSCCGPGCGCGAGDDFERISTAVGYTAEELQAAPPGANLGLGCGNPTAIDEIPEGATVLDLGSGAGIDCFLAARKVGPAGRVIGVDMTPEMIGRARANAEQVGAENVEFRLGQIEALPVADASVDVVISNCVINLSTDKPRVFAEAFRVLRPGGKLMVSDLVLTRVLPDYIRDSAAAYAGCVAGAELKYRYLAQIEAAGFSDVRVTGEDDYLAVLDGEPALDWVPESRRAEAASLLNGTSPVVSLKVSAVKPGSAGEIL